MLLSAAALVVLLAAARLLWDAHRSGRVRLRLVQFRPMAPLVGSASTARVRRPDRA